jgi:uncharacterized protein (DUF433 family)
MMDSVKYAFRQATSIWTQQWYREHERRGSIMAQTPTAHIHLDETGVAWIDDTNVKVIEVVLDKLAHGWSPEEIHFQHPDLSLSQIHAALAYYYDHQKALDAAIEEQLQRVEALMAQAGESPLRKRLRALGKLPGLSMPINSR